LIVGKKKGRNEIHKNRRKRKRFLVPGLVIGLILAVLAWNWIGARSPERLAKGEILMPGDYVRRETKTPLSPALFVGKTARAYQVASEIPEVLDQIYCYCECDKHMGHSSLLSCFTDSHGAT